MEQLNAPIGMRIIIDIKTPQEFDDIFISFTGAYDIIVCLMTDESFTIMNNMLTRNHYIPYGGW